MKIPPSTLPAEKELAKRSNRARPLAQYYSAGNHGECGRLRWSMKRDFDCTAAAKAAKKLRLSFAHGYRRATFCPCPGGDSPSAKRMYDALLAGCIPVILSHDFVWPYTKEFDPVTLTLDPTEFSIRLQASDYEVAKTGENCVWINQTDSLQTKLESITESEIERLRKGVDRAAYLYSYYQKRPDLPNNPMKEGILPDGGAAHALVKALAERARGAFWPECRTELLDSSQKEDVKKFKC